MQRKTLLLLVVTTALTGLLVGALARGAGPGVRDRARHDDEGELARSYAYAIDTTSKAAVNDGYLERWVPAGRTGSGWTGSASGCHKGSISSSYVARLAAAVNFARALNRLDPVSVVADRYSSSSSYSTQAGALLMHANDSLSHDPPSSWRCWSRPAAVAAHESNLSLVFDRALTAGGALDLYLDDRTHTGVGHRRWLIAPRVRTFYVGATSRANVLMPVLASAGTTRANPPFTSWPSRGWFPTPLEPYGRWSWSTWDQRADLSHVRVRVWAGDQEVSVRQYAVQAGYGQPTVVWQLPSGPARTGSWTVRIAGVRSASGTLRPPTTYTVRLFTPWAG